MAMVTRIYAVRDQAGQVVALVRAQGRAQSVRHFVANSYTAELATQDMLIHGLKNGLDVEDATNGHRAPPDPVALP